MFSGSSFNLHQSALEELQPLLQWLDHLITEAIAKAQTLYGVEAASDIHRGLYINEEEVERLLARTPGQPLFPSDQHLNWLSADSCCAWLQQIAGLSDFDLALMLVALAPEIDLRYERLYAYLQDDVTRKRPTVDLALNLLCSSADEKLHRRSHFASDAPLMQAALLQLLPDPHQVQPPLLTHVLKLDDQMVQFWLGQTALDHRLEPFCQLTQSPIDLTNLPLPMEVQRVLQALIESVRTTQKTVKLYLQGVPGIGKRQIAAAIATELNIPLLIADLPRALSLKLDVNSLLRIFFREVQFKKAVLYLPGIDQLKEEHQEGLYQRLLEEISQVNGIVILSGAQPWIPITPYRSGIMSIALDLPDVMQRQAYWQACLAAAGVGSEPQDIAVLAQQFRLTPEQIADAVVQLGHMPVRLGSDGNPHREPRQPPSFTELCTVARSQSGHELSALAHKIQPRYRWADIVLPSDQLMKLEEICNQVKYRQMVYQTWGFDQKLTLGKGVIALFSGPSGTGKTMAAEVIANELQLDLYKIDLSQVVSKYIGETEKKLDRIFTSAEIANAILFFDEADALFGKRSEVKDAHDRYANIEVGYLLQKMEEYEGIAILATNLRQNMDEAFVRRIQVIIEFPFPDAEFRQRIWEVTFPKEAPLENVDFTQLAQEIKLPGGNIKNMALAAAFFAACDRQSIQMKHLIKAAEREHEKLGRNWKCSGDNLV
jgi:SpoVK/Ycf46/Vps4 family AAA+-type ATPase